MAHVKSGGAVAGNRDSQPKKLGVKVFAGTSVVVGNILVRQKGTKFRPGLGTSMGKDYTIFATKIGKVGFNQKLGKKFVTVTS